MLDIDYYLDGKIINILVNAYSLEQNNDIINQQS